MVSFARWTYTVILFFIGLLLTVPGGFLVKLGGSPYYIFAGLTLLVVSIMVARRSPRAAKLYGLILIVTLIWSVFESGLDVFALLPRLAAWLVVGLWFLTPLYHKSLKLPEGDENGPARKWVGLPSLAGAALLAVAAIPNYERRDTGTIRETSDTLATDWRHYGNTAGGTRFAAIDQINTETVGELKEVWRYRTGEEEDFKATPLAVDGQVYFCAATNVLYALDGETGEEIWKYDPGIDAPDKHQYAITCRGVSYYEAAEGYQGSCPTRIVSATVDASLIAVNAKTGESCSDFGENGRVDLRVGMGEHAPNEYYHTSPPTVAGRNLIVGGLVADTQDLGLPSGVVRAFDAETGDLSWAWDVGNPGNRGLPAEGETYTYGTPNVWSIMSYDPELDLVFAPTGNANPDYFGGLRRDIDDKWSSAIIALNGQTGEVEWSYQTVHHDIWDYDIPAQPVLVDVDKDGERVPSIAIPTKMGQIFLLDRRDGTAVHPIEERPVGTDPVLGEYLSPTQPFSSLPNFHPYRHEKDMWGLTPIDQMICRIEYRMMRYEGLYTPPTAIGSPLNAGESGTLLAPGNFGGFNWGSVSVDADNGLLVAAPMLLAHRLLLVTPEQVASAGPRAALLLGEEHPAVVLDPNDPPRDDPHGVSRIAYYGIPAPFMSRVGTAVPCFEPPWSRIAVIDLNTNKLMWSRPVGDMSEAGPFNLRSKLPIDVGTAVRAGTLTTRGGLTFISSTMDKKVRAYSVRTGKELWAQDLPGNGQSTPMSYISEKSGRQMLVITVPNPSWRYPRDPSTGEYIDSQSVKDGKGGYVIAYSLEEN